MKFLTCYDDEGYIKVWALSLRLFLVVFTAMMAIGIPHFSLLMALIGSFTGKTHSNGKIPKLLKLASMPAKLHHLYYFNVFCIFLDFITTLTPE